MELRVCWYPGISNILDIADEDADSEESAATAMAYIKDGIEEDDDVWEDEELLSTMRKALTGIGFEDVMGNGRNYATDLKELASAADNEGLYYYENGDFE